MKDLQFPLLEATDIEIRVGQVSTSKNKANMLLYKNARTDAKILDKVVGVGNWQKRFYTLNGVGVGDNMRSIVVCSVGIYDDEKKEWIWKDDSGSEGNIEQDKSVCSDAFKRGCFAWGLGRELYTAPDIWVPYNKDTDRFAKFKVEKVGYNKDNEISELVISKDGEIVFNFSNGRTHKVETSQKTTQKANLSNENIVLSKVNVGNSFDFANEPKQELNKTSGSITDRQVLTINTYMNSLDDSGRLQVYNYMDKHFFTKKVSALSESQANDFIASIEAKRNAR